ncbi:Probable malonyl-CoA-acyl carrier protein transacylase, mitochondrial [Eumeta japonica]|uniref:Probable malonyl-CoA-acyl carrier protein transacylase, mitochondrial n=1 Tax=Eumeta variegata TaxID=151549 RepID=A0A4C1WEB4_EUMVA|nr:Probable malonyl-CoA-acyl carrier protein transacylase, mitochondrial [Eumeta japonica]
MRLVLVNRFCNFLKLVRFCSGSSRSVSSETPLRKLLDQSTSFGEREVQEPELQWATLPYADELPAHKPQPQTDPRDTAVLLFPGQGSQYVGMGKDLLKFPAARELYDFASSVVGWNVLRVCTEGPEEELTRRCQTCVMVSSLAALERLREERPSTLERARAAAGFSLGEITALTWAGALPLEQAFRLVEVRAAAMEAASRDRPGAMLTVWLAPDARLREAIRRAAEHARASDSDAHCSIASYLYPECKVIAGSEEVKQLIIYEGAADKSAAQGT